MMNIFKKLQNRKKIFSVIILIIFIAAFFVNAKFALAVTVDSTLTTTGAVLGPLGNAISLVLGVIAYILTAVIGLLITVVVALLIQVAQYGNIINVPTVIQGWVIIRDLCNMSFILILLIIAFATILRQENFSAKKILPKLLIMAVLINFSRTIFGLLVDFSQVIMLTFVNAFSAGGGWFVDAFKVDQWYKINPWTGAGSVTSWSTVVAVIAGVLAAIITLIVVSVMLAVLVARIVMLWIYTIFSPLVFLGFAFPPLQKYTGKIWEDFTKQLVVGPVLAFFIWLALTTAQSSSNLLANKSLIDPGVNGVSQICVGAGAFFCEGNLQKFIIVIGLLMGGLIVAQSMGGAAGSIAGKGLDWAKRAPGMLGKGTMKVGSWGARKFAASKHGFEIRPTKIYEGIKEGLAEKKRKEDDKIKEKSATMLGEGKFRGALGASRDFTESAAHGFLWNRAWKMGLKKDPKTGEIDPKKMGTIQSMWRKSRLTKGIKAAEGEKEELIRQRAEETAPFEAAKNKEIEGRKAAMAPFEAAKNKEIEGRKAAMAPFEAAIAELTKKLATASTVSEKREIEDAIASQQLRAEVVTRPFDKRIENQDKKIQSAAEPYNKRIAKIDEEIADKGKDKTKLILAKDDEITKIVNETGKYENTPNAFYARRGILANYDKAAKESGVEDMEEEIVDLTKKAMSNKDVELAVGMILHAAKVHHSNEIVENFEAKKDVYDDTGKLVTKKGDFFDNSNAGLKAFFKQYVQDGLGLSEQQSLFVQSHFSSRAQEANHYGLAQSVGSRHGMYFARSDQEQADRAHSESMKQDAEGLLRRFNRLGVGIERQYRDQDGNIQRRFIPNNLTIKDFIKLAGAIDVEVFDRQRLNPNMAENWFKSYMLHQLNPAQFPEESLVEIMRKMGGRYTNKSGQEITHEQLAMESAAYGGEKYLANLMSKKQDLILSNASQEEKEKHDETIRKVKEILGGLKGKIATGANMVKREGKDKKSKKAEKEEVDMD